MAMVRRHWRGLLLGLVAGTLGLAAVAMLLGPVRVPARQLLVLLLAGPGGEASGGAQLPGPAGVWGGQDQVYRTILWEIRLPRILLALEIGAALALAGATYQGVFRNPLADPYILGVSSGAALGATLAFAGQVGLGWPGLSGPSGPGGGALVPICAFAGALGNTLLVYGLARSAGRMPLTSLLLAGVAVSALASALVSIILLFTGDWMKQVVFWTMGSLSGSSWTAVRSILPFLLIGGAVVVAAARPLDLFLLGEERAESTGLSVERAKLLLLTAGALLSAAAVATGGVVGFVGLIIPHAARLLVGPEHRRLLPVASALGAAFLLAADTLSRLVVAPRELPLGVITALAGAPFFLWLLRQAGRPDSSARAGRVPGLPGRQAGVMPPVRADRPLLACGERGPTVLGAPGGAGGSAGESAAPVLEAIGVKTVLGGRPILHGVSLSIAPGELVAIIGPNGAGKSTLLRTLAGLLPLAGGEVRVGGVSLDKLSRRQLSRRVAFVPQAPDFRFELTVAGVVALGRYAHQSWWGGERPGDREAVARALAYTGLEGYGNRPVTTLSGGEAQRVVLAQALAQEAPFLLLDEPTAHLDLNYQVEIMALLDALRRPGPDRGGRPRAAKAILVVMHDLNLAAAWCDRLILLSAGVVVREGRPEHVLEPSLLEEIYGTPVFVETNRSTGRPQVFVMPPATGTPVTGALS
ncbi:MAG TPA: iron chelate uptake ABC transporter family permease subunit [Firmicutes bacterium]|nr:iron chelate uptake ABC transporter family permease subunit [Bacillota bacterium]